MPANTARGLPYPLPTEPVAEGAQAIRNLAEAAATHPAYVTTLPASPFDGQEVIYGADPSIGTMWRFRYRAAAAAPHRWEFLGGPPLLARWFGGGAFAIASGSGFQAIPSLGPSRIALPLKGVYDIFAGATTELPGGTAADLTLALHNAAHTQLTQDQEGWSRAPLQFAKPTPVLRSRQEAAALTSWDLRGKAAGASINVWSSFLELTPVRVSA